MGLGACAISGYAGYWAYGQAYSSATTTILNPVHFTPFTLISKEAVSSTSSVFTLRPGDAQANWHICGEAWLKGVWSVEVKQPQLQIARSYTPLIPFTTSNRGDRHTDLRLFIRRDPQGEVSGYLHKLPIGAKVELRGPHLEYAIPNDVDEVLFLAGGTGIAPALHFIQKLFHHRGLYTNRLPKIHILWANRRREDALGTPLNEFRTSPLLSSANPHSTGDLVDFEKESSLSYALAFLQKTHAGRLSIQYFVDDEKSFITDEVLSKCLSESEDELKRNFAGRRLIIISGPDGFVNHYAGPKVRQGGVELQGSLGGLLKKLDIHGWEVHKL